LDHEKKGDKIDPIFLVLINVGHLKDLTEIAAIGQINLLKLFTM